MVRAFAASPAVSLAEETKGFRTLCKNRKNAIEAVVLDKTCDISTWHTVWALLGIVLGSAGVVVGFVLWPSHNVVLEPEYW